MSNWIFHMKQTLDKRQTFLTLLIYRQNYHRFSVHFFVQNKITKPIKNIHFFDIIKTQMWRDGFACNRHVGRWGAAAPPDFGRSEGAAGQRRRAALLPAPPYF